MNWFVRPGPRDYFLMLGAGSLIGVTIEWLAVYVRESWKHTPGMPLVSGVGVGLLPILQMLVLPPLIFRAVTLLEQNRLRLSIYPEILFSVLQKGYRTISAGILLNCSYKADSTVESAVCRSTVERRAA